MKGDSKRRRQIIGILFAMTVYYIIHEGAHFLYALYLGTFQQIRFLGLGIQIAVYQERMSDLQLGIFCLAGPVAALLSGYVLAACSGRLGRMKSRLGKACAYYAAIALMLTDPLYLSVLYGFFGGGDMNGIRLLMPETGARLLFGGLFVVNGWLFLKKVKFNLFRKKNTE